MENGRIPKDLLHGELALSSRPTGCPHLHFKAVSKPDLEELGIGAHRYDTDMKKSLRNSHWRQDLTKGLGRGEAVTMHVRRAQRKGNQVSTQGEVFTARANAVQETQQEPTSMVC